MFFAVCSLTKGWSKLVLKIKMTIFINNGVHASMGRCTTCVCSFSPWLKNECFGNFFFFTVIT